MDVSAALSRVDAFSQMGIDALDTLAACARVQRYASGARIIHAGAAGEAMYVILSGEVVVQTAGARPRQIAFLGAGEIFGEMALLTGRKRQADVFAQADTECIIISRKPLYAALREGPSAGALLTELLGDRLVDGKQIRKVGKYRVLEQIGEGGTAIVYAGYHPELRRSVAIKMLRHSMVFDPDFADAFAAEAAIVAQLEHQNIARVFDHENAYATQFIVMELVPGVTLTDIMCAAPLMSESKVRRIILQLADALDYAHRKGIVHRDVKPDNVMIAPGLPLKLMDFGIAQPMTADTDNELLSGTMPYMAPEQAQAGPVDARADIYALGMMAYEMLTDDAPFGDDDPIDCLEARLAAPPPDPRKARPRVSDAMVEFIQRACTPDPDDRFQSCTAVRKHFGHPGDLLRKDAQVQTVTLIHGEAAGSAVRDALDALEAQLAPHDVSVHR